MTDDIEAGGSQPGDYGVGNPDQPVSTGERPAPDAGNTEDIETLVEPLDEDDDVHERLNAISLVNTEQPDRVEQAPDADR